MEYVTTQKLAQKLTDKGDIAGLNSLVNKLRTAPDAETQALALIVGQNIHTAYLNAQAKTSAAAPQQ